MCYHTKLEDDKENIEKKLKAHFRLPELFSPSDHLNGFAKPITPVITIENPSIIELIQWGFLANWQPAPILNAKIETLYELKSFKDYTDNRCLVIVDGFYDWKHEGKNKIKYQIGFGDEIFCLAGIFKYENNQPYYTIITTEAQGIMREIHNSKLRMPFALNDMSKQTAWLHNEPVEPDWDFTAIKV